MGYSEPYSAWFDGLKAALIDEAGPFIKPGQIEFWVDDGIDDLMPDEHLLQALTRNVPHALLCWPGGAADAAIGGGNAHRESVDFVIRYACGAPGQDFENALKADGTTYWGAWAVHDWILNKVFQLEVEGFDTPAELGGVSPVRIAQPGLLAFALRMRTHLLRTYAD